MYKKHISDFIKKNWINMSDEEMALKLNIPIGGVGYLRRSMNLNRPRGGPSALDPNRYADHIEKRLKINMLELEWWITEGGLTLEEVGKRFCSGISRERVRQICDRTGLDHGIGVRTPAWYAVRMGMERYAVKGELERDVLSSGDLRALAKSIDGRRNPGSLASWLTCQAHRLGINLSALRRTREKRKVQCAMCGRRFEKFLSQFNRPDQSHFCDKECFGRYSGKHWGWGRRKCG